MQTHPHLKQQVYHYEKAGQPEHPEMTQPDTAGCGLVASSRNREPDEVLSPPKSSFMSGTSSQQYQSPEALHQLQIENDQLKEEIQLLHGLIQEAVPVFTKITEEYDEETSVANTREELSFLKSSIAQIKQAYEPIEAENLDAITNDERSCYLNPHNSNQKPCRSQRLGGSPSPGKNVDEQLDSQASKSVYKTRQKGVIKNLNKTGKNFNMPLAGSANKEARKSSPLTAIMMNNINVHELKKLKQIITQLNKSPLFIEFKNKRQQIQGRQPVSSSATPTLSTMQGCNNDLNQSRNCAQNLRQMSSSDIDCSLGSCVSDEDPQHKPSSKLNSIYKSSQRSKAPSKMRFSSSPFEKFCQKEQGSSQGLRKLEKPNQLTMSKQTVLQRKEMFYPIPVIDQSNNCSGNPSIISVPSQSSLSSKGNHEIPEGTSPQWINENSEIQDKESNRSPSDQPDDVNEHIEYQIHQHEAFDESTSQLNQSFPVQRDNSQLKDRSGASFQGLRQSDNLNISHGNKSRQSQVQGGELPEIQLEESPDFSLALNQQPVARSKVHSSSHSFNEEIFKSSHDVSDAQISQASAKCSNNLKVQNKENSCSFASTGSKHRRASSLLPENQKQNLSELAIQALQQEDPEPIQEQLTVRQSEKPKRDIAPQIPISYFSHQKVYRVNRSKLNNRRGKGLAQTVQKPQASRLLQEDLQLKSESPHMSTSKNWNTLEQKKQNLISINKQVISRSKSVSAKHASKKKIAFSGMVPQNKGLQDDSVNQNEKSCIMDKSQQSEVQVSINNTHPEDTEDLSQQMKHLKVETAQQEDDCYTFRSPGPQNYQQCEQFDRSLLNQSSQGRNRYQRLAQGLRERSCSNGSSQTPDRTPKARKIQDQPLLSCFKESNQQSVGTSPQNIISQHVPSQQEAFNQETVVDELATRQKRTAEGQSEQHSEIDFQQTSKQNQLEHILDDFMKENVLKEQEMLAKAETPCEEIYVQTQHVEGDKQNYIREQNQESSEEQITVSPSKQDEEQIQSMDHHQNPPQTQQEYPQPQLSEDSQCYSPDCRSLQLQSQDEYHQSAQVLDLRISPYRKQCQEIENVIKEDVDAEEQESSHVDKSHQSFTPNNQCNMSQVDIDMHNSNIFGKELNSSTNGSHWNGSNKKRKSQTKTFQQILQEKRLTAPLRTTLQQKREAEESQKNSSMHISTILDNKDINQSRGSNSKTSRAISCNQSKLSARDTQKAPKSSKSTKGVPGTNSEKFVFDRALLVRQRREKFEKDKADLMQAKLDKKLVKIESIRDQSATQSQWSLCVMPCATNTTHTNLLGTKGPQQSHHTANESYRSPILTEQAALHKDTAPKTNSIQQRKLQQREQQNTDFYSKMKQKEDRILSLQNKKKTEEDQRNRLRQEREGKPRSSSRSQTNQNSISIDKYSSMSPGVMTARQVGTPMYQSLTDIGKQDISINQNQQSDAQVYIKTKKSLTRTSEPSVTCPTLMTERGHTDDAKTAFSPLACNAPLPKQREANFLTKVENDCQQRRNRQTRILGQYRKN